MKEGDKAPNFALKDQDGNDVKLADFKGKKVVLFFYPKADTPGCTKEAIAFTGLAKQFEKAGAAVLGTSPDPCTKQKKFEEKHKLGVRLLADDDHKVAEAFGVWGEKQNYGRTYMGIIRSTFIIEGGKISKAWSGVKVDGHAEKVLEAIKEL
jgi:peroxiredoxin Q/BCP